jgi:hypothetical protein
MPSVNPLVGIVIPTINGDRIAADAARYIGVGYTYGGPGSRPGDWDCSSFVSYVLGHDLGLSLPGGRWGQAGFPPSAHGPVVLSYASWSGATTVTTPQAGDLCVWAGAGPNGHIGIAQSATTMVSALNSQAGTIKSQITGYGPAGVPLTYRRINGLAAGASTPITLEQAPGQGKLAAGVLLALLLPVLLAGGLAVTGLAVAGGAAWLARRAAR